MNYNYYCIPTACITVMQMTYVGYIATMTLVGLQLHALLQCNYSRFGILKVSLIAAPIEAGITVSEYYTYCEC